MITHMTPGRIEYELNGDSYTVHGQAQNPDFGLDYVLYADDLHLTDPARKSEPIDHARKARVLEGIQAELTRRGTRIEIEGDDKLTSGIPHTPGSVAGGLLCTQAGWWFTPAQTNGRRYFKSGEVMPEVGGDYGATIWQWDQSQDPPKL